MATAETISVGDLHSRLRSLGAEFKPAETALFNGKAHIYYSPPSRRWIKVKRHPQHHQTHVVLRYYAECPCQYADD